MIQWSNAKGLQPVNLCNLRFSHSSPMRGQPPATPLAMRQASPSFMRNLTQHFAGKMLLLLLSRPGSKQQSKVTPVHSPIAVDVCTTAISAPRCKQKS